MIGLDEASGYISLVGQAVGNQIGEMYLDALGVDRLSPEQVAEALVDLKRRIQGDFFVIEQDEKRIVLGNRACPFAEKVPGRQSMCMMTSNVDAGCRVVVHLVPQSEPGNGREYFSDPFTEAPPPAPVPK